MKKFIRPFAYLLLLGCAFAVISLEYFSVRFSPILRILFALGLILLGVAINGLILRKTVDAFAHPIDAIKTVLDKYETKK
jgi:hypothetical protein